MDKNNFNKLSVLDQLEYINKELLNGQSLRTISVSLNMSKTTIRDRFEKIGFAFDSNKRQYTKTTNSIITENKQLKDKQDLNINKSLEVANISDTNINPTVSKQSVMLENKQDNNIITFFNKTDIAALQDLISAKDELLNLLRQTNFKKDIIELPEISINGERLSGEVKTRSYTIYESVIKEFKEFCDKNKQFTQKDLLSMAIIEYIDRYKNKNEVK